MFIQAFGPTQSAVQWLPEFFLSGKAAWAWISSLPSSSAKVMNEWICTSTSPYVFLACTGTTYLCVIYFVYFTRVQRVGFWDLESCWFWCGYVGNGLCRLVGCVVAVGEMCCGEGHTACLSLQRGERRLCESNRGLRGPRCIGRRRRHGVTSMAVVRNCCRTCFVPQTECSTLLLHFVYQARLRARFVVLSFSWNFPATFPVTFQP